jgi:divalent metal cation (Fe/Co/Zn/Cd) transporter
VDGSRSQAVRRGVQLELFSALWMVAEMAVSMAAGIAGKSILLTAFGLDSLIELVGSGILLWRLLVESRGQSLQRVETAEKKASWLVAAALALLCIYVFASASYGLLVHAAPESSMLGIAVSAAAVFVMPLLARSKRRLAQRIDSQALAGDAVNSLTCAYMAGTVLLGLGLNALFGWWWIEKVAALAFLFWLGRETWEAFAEARERQEEIPASGAT